MHVCNATMLSFHSNFIRNLKAVGLKNWHISKCYRNMSSFADLQTEFKNLEGGGKVQLEKNNETGIAVMTLQHEERRNAITGKTIVFSHTLTSTLC